MTKHLDRDMVLLHREILSLCARVEEMIDKAGRALCEGRMDLAEQVSNEDDYVDAQEVRIEEECLKMLALHHPVAIDLRRIATVVKVNNDLERIADLAVNISERARGVNEYALFKIPEGVERMVSQSTAMVRDALDAFVNLSTGVARSVILMDDKIDQLNVELIGSAFGHPGTALFFGDSAPRANRRFGNQHCRGRDLPGRWRNRSAQTY
jgi:phosphate transport system protein